VLYRNEKTILFVPPLQQALCKVFLLSPLSGIKNTWNGEINVLPFPVFIAQTAKIIQGKQHANQNGLKKIDLHQFLHDGRFSACYSACR